MKPNIVEIVGFSLMQSVPQRHPAKHRNTE
jgi:hypothetical protein